MLFSNIIISYFSSKSCRLLTLCLQGIEGLPWAEAIQPENVISRILWIAENSLNSQLIEKVDFLNKQVHN